MKNIKIIFVLLGLLSILCINGQENKKAKLLVKENGRYVEKCEYTKGDIKYKLEGNTLKIFNINKDKNLKATSEINFSIDWDLLTECAKSGAGQRHCNQMFDGIELRLDPNTGRAVIKEGGFLIIGIDNFTFHTSTAFLIFLECLFKVCPQGL